jgi:hypothetical protein
MDTKNVPQDDGRKEIRWGVLFHGKLAETHLTKLGAIKAKNRLLREKGWLESEVQIVMINKGEEYNG